MTILINREEIFQAVVDDDAGWQSLVNDNWDCLNNDDRRRIRVLATGRGSGGGGGAGGIDQVFSGTANSTTGDGQLVAGFVINQTPLATSIPQVFINGSLKLVGNGVKTTPVYFSNDSGVTAKAYGAFAAGDSLYWNGTYGGFDLDGSEFYQIQLRK